MSDSSDTLGSFYIQAIAGKLHNNTLEVTNIMSVIATPNPNKHSNHECSPNLQSVTENRDSIETNDQKMLPTSWTNSNELRDQSISMQVP
jgi:hypothetical protein